MPDNPNTWVQALNNIPAELAGVLMAMFIAALRVIYDKEETSAMRVFLESLICGALSLTVSAGLAALALNHNWAVFVGGVIGFFGTFTIRRVALKLLSSRLRSKD